MPKCQVSLFLISFALGVSGATAANDTSICLTTATKLEAGILISADNLLAAHLPCERARERPSDGVTLMHLVVASGAVDDEYASVLLHIIDVLN